MRKAACEWSGARRVGPMPRTSTLSPAESGLLPGGSPASRRDDGWDALADIEVFVFAVEAELEAMERERVGVHRRSHKPDLTLRRRLIGLVWRLLTFGGMQWRVAGWLSGIPFTTLHSTFARWARLRVVAAPGPTFGRRLALGLRRRGPALGGGGRQPFLALRPDGLDAGH